MILNKVVILMGILFVPCAPLKANKQVKQYYLTCNPWNIFTSFTIHSFDH